MSCGIYCITNTEDGKVYIGSSKRLNMRRYEHFQMLRKGKHTNPHLQRAYNLDEEETFQWEVLMYCTKKGLVYWEDWYINFFSSRNDKYGYNLLSADRKEMSEETKAKMSASKKGKSRPPFTEEHRAKLSAAGGHRKGKPSPMKGKKHSEETRAKMSTSRRGENHPLYGKKRSEDTRTKISVSLSGRTLPEETKTKLSIIHKK